MEFTHPGVTLGGFIFCCDVGCFKDKRALPKIRKVCGSTSTTTPEGLVFFYLFQNRMILPDQFRPPQKSNRLRAQDRYWALREIQLN